MERHASPALLRSPTLYEERYMPVKIHLLWMVAFATLLGIAAAQA